MEEKTTGEGLFQLSSRLNLQGGLTFSNATCVVFNANGEREQEKTFQFYPEGMRLSPDPGNNLIFLLLQFQLGRQLMCDLLVWQYDVIPCLLTEKQSNN